MTPGPLAPVQQCSGSGHHATNRPLLNHAGHSRDERPGGPASLGPGSSSLQDWSVACIASLPPRSSTARRGSTGGCPIIPAQYHQRLLGGLGPAPGQELQVSDGAVGGGMHDGIQWILKAPDHDVPAGNQNPRGAPLQMYGVLLQLGNVQPQDTDV